MKHTKEEFENAVKHSVSIASMCRFLGVKPNGGNYKVMHNAIEMYNLDISHFSGQAWNKGLKFKPKKSKPLNEILTKNSNYQSYKLKKRLIKEHLKEEMCECCGNKMWNGKPIPLELHHINGDSTDNRIENLRFLCPNCHAQTPNYRGLNRAHNKKLL